MNRSLPANIAANQRLSNAASYAILAAMLVCVSVTYTQFLTWISSGMGGLQWQHLPFLAFLVGMEVILTRPVVRELEGRERWIYHFAEWITFAVLLKFVLYFIHGFGNLPVDLPRWQENFLTFFEGEYIPSWILLMMVWLIGRATANDIAALNIDPTDLDWEFGKLSNSRSTIRGGLVSRLLWTGIAIVVLAAGMRVNIGAALGTAAMQEPVLNIMIYFFLAIILFSLTQFALLSGRWFWHQTPTSPHLAHSWLRYGLFCFALLAIISFILPTSYSMGLLETLNFLLNWIIAALIFVFQLIFLPIIWLLSLSGCMRQSPDQALENTPSAALLPPPPPSTPIPWLELLQSVLFWGLFILIIAYALIQFIRQNPQLAGMLTRLPVLAWIGSFCRWLSDLIKGASSQVVVAMKEARQRLFTARGGSLSRQVRGWLNFRQLDPRQQIVFYYLRLIERGEPHGLKRKASETPYQYARVLRENLPEVQEDITGLTETFLEARYSNHLVGELQTSRVQRFWRNITRSLEHLRKPETKSK